MPFPEPLLTGSAFPVNALAIIGINQEFVFFGTHIPEPVNILRCRFWLGERFHAEALPHFFVAKNEMLIIGIRRVRMEITHTRFGIFLRFRIDTLPEGIAVTHKIDGIAFIKRSVIIAVVYLNGQFKKLVRVAKLCARSHIRERIRRSAIKANFFDRNSAQAPATDFVERIIDRFVADRIHTVFAERRYSRRTLIPNDKFSKLHHVVDFGRCLTAQGRNGSTRNAELGCRFRVRDLHQSACARIPATCRGRGKIDLQAERLTESNRIPLLDIKRHPHINHPQVVLQERSRNRNRNEFRRFRFTKRGAQRKKFAIRHRDRRHAIRRDS